MRLRARSGGSSVHAALAVFSVGLLATSVLFDVASLATRRPFWSEVAYEDLLLGLAGMAAAAIWAVIEAARTPLAAPTRAAVVLRSAAQVSSLALFAGALGVRVMDRDLFPSTVALVFSAGGLALGSTGAWLTLSLSRRLAD